jgi:hypothetical protein
VDIYRPDVWQRFFLMGERRGRTGPAPGGSVMRLWIGRSILVVALIHSIFGVVFLGGALMKGLGRGVFGSVALTTPSSLATAFWFFVAGALAFMVGGLVHHLESLGLAFPQFLPWSLLALTVVGCLMMPVSAWWLLLAPTVGMFVRAREMGSGDAHAN